MKQWNVVTSDEEHNRIVALRELAKTCNFCSNECIQKAIRDQIIEGLQDGEFIQELLQARDLSLDQSIIKCRSLEAAKRSRQDIEGSLQVSVIRSRTHVVRSGDSGICFGCGQAFVLVAGRHFMLAEE